MTLKDRFDSIINEIEELVGSGQHDITEITQTVARSHGLDLRLLADAFRFMTDMTMGEYIKRRLVICALDIKLECELSVEDVCENAGYADAPAFSKACKKLFDYSPAQFTKQMLSKYPPLFFDHLIADKETDQLESEILTTTQENNTICGVSVAQFVDIKQVLELSAIYGFTDEESEAVYQLAQRCDILIAQAAEFYDDFKLQLENGSNVPGLDFYEMAELACKYSLSCSEAQSILYMLEKNGYHSIRELPETFFDIYFSRENERFAGWDVPYMCEIAEELEAHDVSVDELEDIVFLAWMNGTDLLDAIANHKKYEDSFNKMAMDALNGGLPEDDTGGFGYKNIWELPEE